MHADKSRAVIIGSPREDKTGTLILNSLRRRGVDARWMNMDDLMDQMTIGRSTLREIAEEDPFATDVEANEVVIDVDSPLLQADLAFLVSDAFPPFEHIVISTIHRYGLVLPNHPDAVRCVADKWKTDQVLRDAQLAVPYSVLVDSIDHATSVAEEFLYPLVIKQVGGTQGTGVRRATNDGELVEALTALGIDQQALVVQQYIECDASDRRMLYIDGTFLAGFLRKAAPGDFRSNTALGGSVASCQFTDEQIAFGQQLIEALGLRFGGLDIGVVSEVLPGREYLPVGTPFCIEANATPALYSFPETHNMDLSENLADSVLAEVLLRKRPVA